MLVGSFAQVRRRKTIRNGVSRTPWTPADIGASLAAWWDPAAGVVLNGSNVASWTDRRSGAVAAQATALSQPVFSPIGLNGLPGLTGDGVNSFLQSSPATLAAALPLWMAMVAKRGTQNDNTASGIRGLFAIGPAGEEGVGFAVQRPGSNPAQTTLVWGRTYNGAAGMMTAFAEGDSSVLLFQAAADGSGVAQINGGAASTVGAFSVPAVASGTAFVLACGGSTVRRFAGVVGDCLFGTAALSADDTARLQGFLAWKYGLQGNLPGNHPYRSDRPYT